MAGGIPATDASAAFDYYMKKHPEVYDRMLAAYVIGYSTTLEYLAKNPHLKFAKGAKDTGVIISYNTEAPQVAGKNPVVLPGVMAIIPLPSPGAKKRQLLLKAWVLLTWMKREN